MLDLTMPGIKGLDVCQQIKNASPETKVIVLTSHSDTAITQRAFSVGASAFVLKHLMVDDLPNAIQKAMRP